MSAADIYGTCPRCGVNVDPWGHDCPIYPTTEPEGERELDATLPAEGPCGFTMTDSDGEQTPCDEAGVSWRWYQGYEHEDMLERACTDHENPGGIRMAALTAEVRRLREERDRLRSTASGHIFDPENYISPLRPQIRALRDAILVDTAETDTEPAPNYVAALDAKIAAARAGAVPSAACEHPNHGASDHDCMPFRGER